MPSDSERQRGLGPKVKGRASFDGRVDEASDCGDCSHPAFVLSRRLQSVQSVTAEVTDQMVMLSSC